MFSTLCYVTLYYNIDAILINLYLPYINSINANTNANFSPLHSYKEFYFLLQSTSYFMLFLYTYLLVYRLIIAKRYDRACLGLSFVYVKHLLDILIKPSMSLLNYETHRAIMWTFTTPLMLKMYCNTNDLVLRDINFHYNMFIMVPHMFFIPFKHNIYLYIGLSVVLFVPAFLFIRTLTKYKHVKFTNLYILIWLIFMIINVVEITNMIEPTFIHAFYNIADTLCKFICNFVISDYEEQEHNVRENMDLQSVNFLSHMIKNIKNFETDNKKITDGCSLLIANSKKNFMNRIPKTTSKLQLDLLTKILPFDFDKDYINNLASAGPGAGPGAGPCASNKKFEFICILFLDVVNYTELAKKFDCSIIFKLLHDIYCQFDIIIKKYGHLQKIETIGDAYMVVGDIFRNELNHATVIKEILLLAFELNSEIKKIETPDQIPLSTRIGVHMGHVNIGILGNEIPRLCVVGNSVNVAARLQSCAEPNTIQMSRHVYEFAKDIDFDRPLVYKENQNVFLKNIGTYTTYTIDCM